MTDDGPQRAQPVDTTGLFWAEHNEEAAAKVRDGLLRCARDRGCVPDPSEYKRWLRQRQQQGEYPPTVFLIELLFNGWVPAIAKCSSHLIARIPHPDVCVAVARGA